MNRRHGSGFEMIDEVAKNRAVGQNRERLVLILRQLNVRQNSFQTKANSPLRRPTLFLRWRPPMILRRRRRIRRRGRRVAISDRRWRRSSFDDQRRRLRSFHWLVSRSIRRSMENRRGVAWRGSGETRRRGRGRGRSRHFRLAGVRTSRRQRRRWRIAPGNG